MLKEGKPTSEKKMHLEAILHLLGEKKNLSNMKRFLYQKEVLSIMCIIFHI